MTAHPSKFAPTNASQMERRMLTGLGRLTTSSSPAPAWRHAASTTKEMPASGAARGWARRSLDSPDLPDGNDTPRWLASQRPWPWPADGPARGAGNACRLSEMTLRNQVRAICRRRLRTLPPVAQRLAAQRRAQRSGASPLQPRVRPTELHRALRVACATFSGEPIHRGA